MSLMTNFKARRAMMLHGRDKAEQAIALYNEAYAAGLNKAQYLLPYSILLLRRGEYDKAGEVLRKVEKSPGGITPPQRTQMLSNYAIVCWKQGRIERALELLEDVYRKGANGNIYQILGYMLIENGDFERALAFNKEAVDYDDEDPIMLDNLAQTYYRLGDGAEHKLEAKKWFEKALEHRPEAIDTNYFLALYDIEAGDTEAAHEKLALSASGRFSPLNYATPERVQGKIAELG